jgi:hypothetical protein
LDITANPKPFGQKGEVPGRLETTWDLFAADAPGDIRIDTAITLCTMMGESRIPLAM